jgi:ABC-2 type transport system permease protein
MTASSAAISVEQLTRVFVSRGQHKVPVRANDNISFTVQRGEVFGLLGPNGAGKTTLIWQLMGLLAPTSGHITVEGIDVVRYPERVKQIVGFLPQAGAPMRAVEVEQALRFTGRLRGQTDGDARAQAQLLMRELELLPHARRLVQQLSGGMRRLVDCAMALMGQPQLLILDEPTNELDPHKRQLVWNLIARLSREYGSTCVLVTHNVLEAEKVLQRVAVIVHGRMITVGTPSEIKQRAGGKIRLELRLREETHDVAVALRELAAVGSREQRPGVYRFYLDEHQIPAATAIIVQRMGLNALDDFRLAPPSLEDVYLDLDHNQQ